MVFDQPKMNIGEDIMTIDDFFACQKCGALIPDDGCGHWGTETHFTYTGSIWRHLPPEGATHVHWYNK